MQINQNLMAFNAQRNLSNTQNEMSSTLEKLSSGFRINRAADDAAGLSISEQLRSEVRGLQQAQRNAQDGVSVVQTAEGALTEVHEMLQRMRELAVQAENTGANDTEARDAIQAEITELAEEVDRVTDDTAFSGQALLDGSYGVDPARATGVVEATDGKVTVGDTNGDLDISIGETTETINIDDDQNYTAAELEGALNDALGTLGTEFDSSVANSFSATVREVNDTFVVEIESTDLGGEDDFTLAGDLAGELNINGGSTDLSGEAAQFQVGANQGETINVSIGAMGAESLGIDGLDVNVDAGEAITAIDNAISEVSEQRSELGALQNRLEHTIANLGVTTENLQASESRIRDADMAEEMVDFTRHQVLQQSGTAMLAQANQVPQSVLQLLG